MNSSTECRQAPVATALRAASGAGPSGHNLASRHAPKAPQKDPLLTIIQAAGWPIWPLLLCSVIALTLVIEKMVSLRMQRVAPPRLLDEVISVTRAHLPAADVVNKLAANSVLGNVLASGLRAVIAEPRISEAALRDSFESAGRAALHRLDDKL